jgi:anaerobic selenocysteine-containing dehydrogenase
MLLVSLPVLSWGNGLDSNINSFQTARAISILRAITGNLGIPGGEIEWSAAEAMSPTSAELNQPMAISSELRARRIGAEEHILPTYFSALPQKIVKAMLTSKPYSIRAAYVPGAAMLHSYNNSPEVMKALKSLDFLAVADFFLTPTAEMADIVLPVATYLETDSIHECAVVPVVSIIQKVAQVGEAWSDLKIYNELAKRMGMGASFWNSESDTLDYLLQPSGVKFEEFRKIGILCVEKEYRNYETKGFETPSNKVEIYSSQLEQGGFDPLPVFHEVPESPFSPSEFTRKYPLVLINWKVGPYLHSAGRQIPALRNSHPDPLVILNSETAAKLGIKEGDWVYIENKRGKIRQKAALSDKIDPRVVIAEHGWWYPEKETGMHGWAESNLNMLTDNNPPYGEIGSTSLKGFSCKVYPC